MAKGGGWNALFWNNHDQPARLIDLVILFITGQNQQKCWQQRCIYCEELHISIWGRNRDERSDYTSMSDYVDVECQNAYQELLATGKSAAEAFEIIKTKSRDNSRTPMQWDNSKYAGFSAHKPWLMPTNQDEVNVKDEFAHGEIFAYYQKLIKLRKTQPIIAQGDFKPLMIDNKQVFAYLRNYQDQTLIVLNNFYGKSTTVELPDKLCEQNSTVLISNYDNAIELQKQIELQPYQSVAFLLN